MKPLLSVSQPGRSSPAQRLSSAADKFAMPSEPPTREQWVADSAVSVCMVCKVERFSMVSKIVNNIKLIFVLVIVLGWGVSLFIPQVFLKVVLTTLS